MRGTDSLLRNRNFNLGAHHRHVRGEQAHVSQALLHDHGGNLGTLRGVAREADAVEVDCVPVRLANGEWLVQHEFDGVVLTHLVH